MTDPISSLEKMFNSFRIIGAQGVDVEGSMTHGYAINIRPGGALTGVIPTTPGTGACCIDGDCFITTAADCELFGGTFLGVDSECEENICNPCPCVRDIHAEITIVLDITCGEDCNNEPCDFHTIFTDSWDFPDVDLCDFDLIHQWVHPGFDVNLVNFRIVSDYPTGIFFNPFWHIQDFCCGAEFNPFGTVATTFCPTPPETVTFNNEQDIDFGDGVCGHASVTAVLTIS